MGKHFSEMNEDEQKQYLADLRSKLEENIELINSALPEGQKIAQTKEEKERIISEMLSPERIAMHERAKDSGLATTEYTNEKSAVYNKYVPNGILPDWLSRVQKYMPKSEKDSSDNAEENREMFEGIYRDDRIGDQKRRDLQLKYAKSVTDIVNDKSIDFSDEKNCTFSNTLDFGLQHFDACGAAIDLGYTFGGADYALEPKAEAKLKHATDLGNVLGAAAKDAVVFARDEAFLTLPLEMLSDQQYKLVEGAVFTKYPIAIQYKVNREMREKLPEETKIIRSEYPDGLEFKEDDIAAQPKNPSMGGYLPRKKLILDFCRGIRELNLDSKDSKNLKDVCRQLEEILNKDKVLSEEDVPEIVKLCHKYGPAYKDAMVSDSKVSKEDKEKIKALEAGQKKSIELFRAEGYLKTFAEDARENLQKQKQELVSRLMNGYGFDELKESIADIAQDLKATDDFYVWTNTRNFNEMRDAAYELNKSMQAVKSEIPSKEQAEKLAELFMKVSDRADAYATAKLESIKNEMKEHENSPKQRSIHRLASAMNLQRLVEGERPHPIGKNHFKEQVGVLLHDVNTRFNRYAEDKPILHDNKPREEVEEFAVALERYLDKHPKILDNEMYRNYGQLKDYMKSRQVKNPEKSEIKKEMKNDTLSGPGFN